MAAIGKRMKAARAAVEGKANLSVEEAVKLIKSAASAKFDETVEVAVNLGVDPRHVISGVERLHRHAFRRVPGEIAALHLP